MKTFDFNKVSLDQILIFSDIVAGSKLLLKEHIERKYLTYAKNFDETVQFLNGMGLLGVRSKRFVVNSKYEIFLKENNISKNNPAVKEFLLNNLINRNNLYLKYVNDYLSQFTLVNEQFEFKATLSQRLKFSGLRNLLIELGLVYLNIDQKKYFISEDKQKLLSKHKNLLKLSHEKFLKIMEEKEILGKNAELRIIQFEKDRLSKYPSLTGKIDHIAVSDVKAGYDIKSYSVINKKSEDAIPRYIEVKAVSQIDYKFFWTANELETAKNLKGNYYLYLLPVLGKNKFDLDGLRMISAPYSNVYKKEVEWAKREELISCSLYMV
jgi:hypothetical protein